MYAFKTAKYWGRGPRNWTVDLLRFEQFKAVGLAQSPRSPVLDFDTMVHQQFYSVVPQGTRRGFDKTSLIVKPSPLCRWSIHYHNDIQYEPCKTRTPSPQPDCDPLDEGAWKLWPSSETNQSMSQTLTEGLGSNLFSDLAPEDLPIALNKVSQTLKTTDENFLEETLGFSIMARNVEMVDKILMDLDDIDFDSGEGSDILARVESSMPFHLAIMYLDGSKACCNILDSLRMYGLMIRASDTNNLGHTLFDCLMMTILKAHTNVTPAEIDDGLRDEKSFPGEEVDICGRFDADSDNVRALVAAGSLGIPFSWKHKFCHTSTQAICHCIQIFAKHFTGIGDDQITDIPSGLFVKRCVCCGLKMQLSPIHTLVLVAFRLGQSGAEDEDLFGIIAILLCILRFDSNLSKTVDISMVALFPEEESREAESTGCSHSPLRARQVVELAWRRTDQWSSKAKTGWAIIYHILRITEDICLSGYEPVDCVCRSSRCPGEHAFSGNGQLLALDCAVQTEILTYRRLREEDPWVSPFFDMLSVLRSLETGESLSIDLITKGMMQPLCDCGWFCGDDRDDPWSPRAEHVMKYPFSNLDDWFRTTFISRPYS